jgi:hypothetical protein
VKKTTQGDKNKKEWSKRMEKKRMERMEMDQGRRKCRNDEGRKGRAKDKEEEEEGVWPNCIRKGGGNKRRRRGGEGEWTLGWTLGGEASANVE